jgi:exodeoxyribonuclease III
MNNFSDRSMQIATWNVNSIRTRLPIVTDWLKNNSIDLLCLQETKVIDADFPRQEFEELGYNLYVCGQKSYNGVAIFSLQPLQETILGFSPIVGEQLGEEFDEQKRVIVGITDDLILVNLYVPNGAAIDSDKYIYKLRWLQTLKEYLRKIQVKYDREICICGDFNIAPEDRDIYNAKGKESHIMFSLKEREQLKDILSLGFTDIFRKLTPEGGHFSWWDYRQGGFQKNRGWRIDCHYLTSKLCDRAISCTIDVEPRKLPQPSDHTPVILELSDD